MRVDATCMRLEAIVEKGRERALAAVSEAVREALETARRTVPVDTGRLLKSISSEVRQEEGRITGGVSARTPYALYVEFGTGRRAENGNGNNAVDGAPPQPYMRPAFISGKERLERRLKEGKG